MPFRASLLALLTLGLPLPPTTPLEPGGGMLLALVPAPPGAALLSGQPELVEFVDNPQVSSPPKPKPGELVFLTVLLEPLPPMPT